MYLYDFPQCTPPSCPFAAGTGDAVCAAQVPKGASATPGVLISKVFLLHLELQGVSAALGMLTASPQSFWPK
jgi:hypothetical protein